MDQKFKFIKKYIFLLGLLVFVIILFTSDIENIFRSIRHVHFQYLALGAIIAIPILLTKAIAWNYLKKRQGMKYKLKDSFLMYCSGSYVGLITPGKIGELARTFYLKKDGYAFGKSLVSSILDRFYDIAVLLILSLGISLFSLTVFGGEILTFALGIIILALVFILLVKIDFVKWILNKILYILIPKNYQNSWKINFQEFVDGFKTYKIKDYLTVFIINIISWSFYYLQMGIIAKSANINIPLLHIIISVTIASLVTLIPVSIFGIGTRDAALILLLTPFAIPVDKIIVFSTLILLMSLTAGLIGLICWIIKPIKF
jgi:uncharacterized protein (TIRG00374 family)